MSKTLILANQIAAKFGTAFILTPAGYAARTQYSSRLLVGALMRQHLSVSISIDSHLVYLCA